jgi:Holliday junction resolvase
MKETKFANAFIDKIKTKFPYSWSFNVHGHASQESGIPDNLLNINGLFVAIEFKVQRDGKIKIEPNQVRQINEIKNGKGIALIVAYNEANGKILIRERRLNIKKLFFSSKSTSLFKRIDWDFELSTYDDAIDLISVIISNGGYQL